jgi:hypothetical protein
MPGQGSKPTIALDRTHCVQSRSDRSKIVGHCGVLVDCTEYMGSDSINQYYAAPCLFGLPFGNGTALRSVKRSIFD